MPVPAVSFLVGSDVRIEGSECEFQNVVFTSPEYTAEGSGSFTTSKK